jgi:hypothetical protein
MYLTEFQPMGGGEVSMDLTASGSKIRDGRNTIPKGSATNPGKEVGFADLMYWTDDAVYVWDAKHANGSAERDGKRMSKTRSSICRNSSRNPATSV